MAVKVYLVIGDCILDKNHNLKKDYSKIFELD